MRAAGVPMEVLESFGGWSANSRALREHYLDMGVVASGATTAFFRSPGFPPGRPFRGSVFQPLIIFSYGRTSLREARSANGLESAYDGLQR